MKIEIYNCDGCKKVWDLKYDPGVYIISHESLVFGSAIMGDNRINSPKHFCKDCWEIIYKSLPK
jgi:hypothetical protein